MGGLQVCPLSWITSSEDHEDCPDSYIVFSNSVDSIVHQNHTMMNKFQSLIKSIASILGPTSGVDSADVNVDDLINTMKLYKSNEDEWLPFALGDVSRNYTRNLVDDTNGKSNILIVVWVSLYPSFHFQTWW